MNLGKAQLTLTIQFFDFAGTLPSESGYYVFAQILFPPPSEA